MNRPDDAERERLFEADLRALLPEWRQVADLLPGRIPQMITYHGAVGAVRTQIRKSGLSNGFIKLRDAHRLNLTLEYLLLRKEYGSLFSLEERAIARRRLTENGMSRDELPLEPYDP